MAAFTHILDYWFGEDVRDKWFVKDADFDRELRQRLFADHEKAIAGRYADWLHSADGCVALCILFDQVPRNIYRDDPRAFAYDQQARAVTYHALAKHFDEQLSQVKRIFLYMPLEHSEEIVDQDLCVQLTTELDEDPRWYDYAVKHRDIIARFGRFPHRNAVLGREATDEETAFLKQPGSSF